MDREIKFRAWHGDHMKMELPEKQLSQDIDYWDGVKGSVLGIINSYLKQGSDRIFMQYTGLKDKNGKEIYEGDLIRLCNNKNGVFEVIFVNSYQGGWNLKEKTAIDTVSLGARHPSELEVIGNIYENPSADDK